jgi:hypothetical protein
MPGGVNMSERSEQRRNTSLRTKLLHVTLGAGMAAAAAGCGTAVDKPMMMTPQQQLTGTWLSQGSDVAPLLAGPPFNNVSVKATFSADSTYSVVSVDTANKEVDYAGTYTIMTSAVAGIVSITCMQSMPSNAIAQGMYQIDTTVTPARMQYEVVQTQPTNGLTPPTPDKGFGSTVYNGKPISTLIQKYTRQ